jgi:hypothetical protein
MAYEDRFPAAYVARFAQLVSEYSGARANSVRIELESADRTSLPERLAPFLVDGLAGHRDDVIGNQHWAPWIRAEIEGAYDEARLATVAALRELSPPPSGSRLSIVADTEHRAAAERAFGAAIGPAHEIGLRWCDPRAVRAELHSRMDSMPRLGGIPDDRTFDSPTLRALLDDIAAESLQAVKSHPNPDRGRQLTAAVALSAGSPGPHPDVFSPQRSASIERSLDPSHVLDKGLTVLWAEHHGKEVTDHLLLHRYAPGIETGPSGVQGTVFGDYRAAANGVVKAVSQRIGADPASVVDALSAPPRPGQWEEAARLVAPRLRRDNDAVRTIAGQMRKTFADGLARLDRPSWHNLSAAGAQAVGAGIGIADALEAQRLSAAPESATGRTVDTGSGERDGAYGPVHGHRDERSSGIG